MTKQQKQALRELAKPNVFAYTVGGKRLVVKDGGLNASYPIKDLYALCDLGYVLIRGDKIGISVRGTQAVQGEENL